MDILTDLDVQASFESKMKGLSISYQRNAKVAINHFQEFCRTECDGRSIIQTFDYLKGLSPDEKESKLYHLFQMWINKLSETRDVTTTRNYFMTVKKLARHHNIKVSIEDVKDNLIFPKKLKERKYVMTIDDVKQILQASSYKKKGFYLFMLSTGMRPKEALSIRKRHVTLLNNGRYLIKIPAEATKLKMEREAFTSTEVLPYLSKVLRTKDDNDYIWTNQENKINAVTTAGSAFRDCCDRIGLTQKYETVNRFKLNLYCFRAFFYSKASKIHGDEYAHKAIGHSGYLQQYDRKTLDEKLQMYEAFENELLTDQTLKHKVEIKILEEKANRIDELEARVKNQDKVFADKIAGIYDKMLADRRKMNEKSPEQIVQDMVVKAIEKSQKNVKTFKKNLENS